MVVLSLQLPSDSPSKRRRSLTLNITGHVLMCCKQVSSGLSTTEQVSVLILVQSVHEHWSLSSRVALFSVSGSGLLKSVFTQTFGLGFTFDLSK